MNMDDETLNRLAVEALLEEAKLGAQRAEIMGPSGWVKPKETINKRFLHSTLRNAVISNKHRSLKQEKVKVQSYKADTVKKS
ncbi:protein POLR1D [Anoplolepis gracilipes]|uniref:protein POLR1D n=1 Tax=Anoplolepis gracilipes TaxID=354296 RepID=UPI003BA29035